MLDCIAAKTGDELAVGSAARVGRPRRGCLPWLEWPRHGLHVLRELALVRDCVLCHVVPDVLSASPEPMAQLRALDRAIDNVVVDAIEHYLETSERARDAAERRVAHLEAILESLPEGIVIGTPQRIERCNEAAVAIAGWRSVNAAAKEPTEFAARMRTRDADSGEPLSAEELPFTRALRGETATRDVLISREDTGEDVIVRMSAAPIRTESRVIGAVSLTSDITSDKHAEELVREHGARLQAILDYAPVAVFLRDRDSRFVLVNRWYAEIFGVDLERVVGRSIRELHPDRPVDLVELQEAADREVIESKKPIDRDETYVLHGEERTHLLVEFPILDREGNVYAVCGISADVTIRRRREKSRERVIAILGHDLRNPVNAILLGARMLRSDDLSREARTRIAARIANSAERMNRMIADLLDFARGHLGKGIPIEPRFADLGAIAKDVLDELKTALPDLPATIMHAGDLTGTWDRERLAQVLGNLVGNAAQHRPPGTTIWIELTGAENDVFMTVKNKVTEPISPECLEKIFEPFHAGTASSPAAGLGLGLYIVREIVRAHGGTVEATCSEDEFSIFVRLPRSTRA